MGSECFLFLFCFIFTYIWLNWCQLNDFPKQFDLDAEQALSAHMHGHKLHGAHVLLLLRVACSPFAIGVMAIEYGGFVFKYSKGGTKSQKR